MTEKYGTYYKMIAVLVDLSLVNISGFVAHFVCSAMEDGQFQNISLIQVLLVNFIWFNVTQITRLYKDIFVKDAVPTIRQSLWSLVFFASFLALLDFLVPEFNVSNRLFFVTAGIFSPMFLIAKICFLLLRRSHRARLISYTRVVIVGAGPVGLELAEIMESRPSMGIRVVGFFDDSAEVKGKDGKPVNLLGKMNDCIAYVKKHSIKEVYCALPDRAIGEINQLMRRADQEMIRLKIVPDVKDYFHKNVNVRMLGHFPVISPRSEPLESVSNKLFKRIFDIVFSLLVVVFVMSWLIPLMAILIKLESKGPVFFRQPRTGKDKKSFYCLKFRSMRLNADSNSLQASKNDKRITRVGSFMRKTSIDELPQFFNVLIGDMSVVGPRPHMLQHTAAYSAVIDHFMVRHFLLPGITGWAQVNGLRGETSEEGSMEARVQADIWYMENWSVLLDLKIAFLTVWQVIFGHSKAY